MQISMIVGMARNREIGINNELPWHLPADLKHFKAVTMGKPIIMGRKTFESIGKPLPGRVNIVITRNRDWTADGAEVVHTVDEAISAAGSVPEVMIIGGAEIYGLMLDQANKLYVTEVDLDVAGDAFFPEISSHKWRETSRQSFPAEDTKPAYAFVTYER